MLQRCRAHGIVLSKKKFKIGRGVNFAGHNVTDGDIKPDKEMLGAISKFPTLRDTHQASSASPTSSGTSSLIWRWGQSK